MNEDEKELLKAGADAAMKPFASLIERLFGGPAEEIGGMWQDALKVRRRLRQIKLLEKLQAQIDEAGFDPQTISDSIWVPVMQEALLQDDEDLQSRWASLLANAADPRQLNPVLPPFANMLKELTKREALFLEALLQAVSGERRHDMRLWADRNTGGFSHAQLMEICFQAKLFRYEGHPSQVSVAQWEANKVVIQADERNFEEIIGVLKRNGILDEIVHPEPIDIAKPLARAIETRMVENIDVKTKAFYKLSKLGAAFLNACCPPAKSGDIKNDAT